MVAISEGVRFLNENESDFFVLTRSFLNCKRETLVHLDRDVCEEGVEFLERTNYIHLYTDGSRLNGRTGLGNFFRRVGVVFQAVDIAECVRRSDHFY